MQSPSSHHWLELTGLLIGPHNLEIETVSQLYWAKSHIPSAQADGVGGPGPEVALGKHRTWSSPVKFLNSHIPQPESIELKAFALISGLVDSVVPSPL